MKQEDIENRVRIEVEVGILILSKTFSSEDKADEWIDLMKLHYPKWSAVTITSIA